ncbi:hypothetical protein KVQ90_18865, partial [Escherichia coli]|nr:hypothetical protein [Escherichia coli]
MHKLIVLSLSSVALLIPSISSALTVHGDIHPERYTFFLTQEVKWSTKTGHRVRVFSSIDFPIRLVVTHHYIRAVLVRCNIQRY